MIDSQSRPCPLTFVQLTFDDLGGAERGTPAGPEESRKDQGPKSPPVQAVAKGAHAASPGSQRLETWKKADRAIRGDQAPTLDAMRTGKQHKKRS